MTIESYGFPFFENPQLSSVPKELPIDSPPPRLQRSLQISNMEQKNRIDLNTIQLNDIEPLFACGVIPYPTNKNEVNEITDLCLRFFHRRQLAEETLEMYYDALLKLYALVPDDLKCEEDFIKVFIVGIYSKPIIISFQIMESAHFPRHYEEVLHLAEQYDHFTRNLTIPSSLISRLKSIFIHPNSSGEELRYITFERLFNSTR
ncbi:unnamed protein product [Lepeophtheirus salmonis]|uniref:(salmon louse) hypothetical protein n=1 Tax=Lepeophtheirus salmonis TaxID=72036 RepID=A0A7R8H985_LEPSM|nr:unnamed protein product [Lepeophtheirus salmonis]CAF2944772.1 unnamed protein product [Lepeophtheirus salmonis]